MAIHCERAELAEPAPDHCQRRVGLIIPAYNEARQLARVVARCRAVRPALVLVVDDCSTDQTPQVLSSLAGVRRDGVRVVGLRNQRNLGKQGSVVKALRLLRPAALDAVAIIDGDGQHDPRELPPLAALLTQYDAVIGARSRDQMPPQRRLSNALVNLGFQLLSGVDFVDVQSGLRLYRKELADVLAARLPEVGGYGLEHESLTVLARHARDSGAQLTVAAAPISCVYGDEVSSMTALDMTRLGWQTLRQGLHIRRACGDGVPCPAPAEVTGC